MYLTRLMTGYDDGTFRPDEIVTNEQLIAVMGRLATFLNMSLYDVMAAFDEAELSKEQLSAYPEWMKQEAGLMMYTQQLREDGSAAIM